MAAPPSKKQKTEEEKQEAEEPKESEPAKVEPPKESEADAPACKKPKNAEPARFLVQDTTMNVMVAQDSSLLMSLSDGGMQHLLAGAKANLGVKGGRYMFEVKIVEYASVADGVRNRYALKIGFATSSSNLFLGDTEESICFDMAGSIVYNRTLTPLPSKVLLTHGSVVAAVLNLDQNSPNANTISLFKDGARVCQPQPLPEKLKGKPLFPVVTFKNMTTHVNFGPQPLAPLAFKCRMVQDAVKADIEVTKDSTPAGGKCEVLFPVGLPDEGTFDRLDMFLEKNSQFLELSDRMLISWAEKSGIWRTRGRTSTSTGSNDRPERNYQIPVLDDDSLRRAMYAIAPLQARNYVVMEVKGNLIDEERKALLERFPRSLFKRVAHVVVGKPPSDYAKRVQAGVLKDKQEKSDRAFEIKKQEKLRLKAVEKKKKEQEKLAKKALKEATKRVAEAKKKMEEEAARKAAEEGKAVEERKEGDEAKEETKAEETKEEEVKEEEVKQESEEEDEDEEMEAEEPEEEPPKVELTEEDKKLQFIPTELPDVAPMILSSSLSKFTIPSKAEGFDEVRCEWSSSAKAAEEYLKQWVTDRKMNSRVEDLKPSAWFHEQVSEFGKVFASWKMKQGEYHTARRAKEASWDTKKKGAVGKLAAAKNNIAHAVAKAQHRKRVEGEPPLEEELQKVKAEGEEAVKAAEKELKEIEEAIVEETKPLQELEEEFKELDIFDVDDILDVGHGAPLFKDFKPEDWALVSHIFELNLLVHSFVRDVADPERPGVHINHLAFYYKKYYNRDLVPRDFGKETLQEVVGITGDKVLHLTAKDVLATQLDAEFESFGVFVKIIESFRRDRLFRMDLGEEGVALKVSTSRFGGADAGDLGRKGGGRADGGKFGRKGGLGKGGAQAGAAWFAAAARPMMAAMASPNPFVNPFAAMKGGGKVGGVRSNPFGKPVLSDKGKGKGKW